MGPERGDLEESGLWVLDESLLVETIATKRAFLELENEDPACDISSDGGQNSPRVEANSSNAFEEYILDDI